MRWIMGGLGVVVSLGLLAVSMAMNFQFGLTLGRDPLNSMIYGVASVCGDGLKALAPFALAWGWRERRFAVAGAALALFMVSTAYSLTSALGFAAWTRAEASGARVIAATQFGTLLEEREQLTVERRALGSVRPVEAITSAIRGAEQHQRWRSTSGCTDATVPQSIAFCEGYFALQAERASAERKAEIDQRLAELRETLGTADASAASGSQEPQVAALTRILPVDAGVIQLGLLLLVTAFVELGSGLGFFVTLAPLRAERSAREPAAKPEEAATAPIETEAAAIDLSDTAWAAERLVSHETASAALTDLFTDYAVWCAAKERRQVLSPGELAAWLSAQGYSRNRRDGREVVDGIRLSRPEDVILAFRR